MSCSVPSIPGSGSSSEPQGNSEVAQEFPIPQDHVLGATGCGASCGMKTEQLSHLEDIGNGWKRVKVKRTILVNKCDYETRVCETIPAPFMEEPIFEEWIFANCSNKKFAIGSTPFLIDSRYNNPFFEDGELVGKPNYSTASLNPFMQWAKMCKQEAVEGWNDIRGNTPNPVLLRHQYQDFLGEE